MSDSEKLQKNTPEEENKTDERVKEMSQWRKALIRPELGSICGVILVFVIFFLIARDSGMFSSDGVMNWLIVSSQFAILAVGACLLMIAGEFDLSIGSMIGFSGIIIAITSVHYQWPVSLSILFAFVCAMVIGFINGYIVIHTGLPSFIVSLAFLYILRGLTIWLAILFTRRTIISGVTEVAEDSLLASLFGGVLFKGTFRWLAENGIIATFTDGTPVVQGIPALVIWAIVLIIIGQFILTRTHYGNWIFASGGDAQAARYVGVPVNHVKITLFVVTAFCATIFATCQVMEFGSAAADRGLLKEFEAIISVVIGGALLTGGYGSVIGATLGALIFGVVQQGLFFAGVESSLFRVFLGAILLIAVVFNTYIRRLITGEK
ncbi:ABC transporter permease [candidate division KSB3 bacterium]|uniref:Xylose transport system permease protein XylH n=1 Tax=candidate division KSB3 bacterium TaxID=2044937 RepID=A0A9D5Q8D7_9BACT|nr:ABC transporter permease [candidate division KSB3 bacterium]MBD3327237.1 ABC transporter permease [candidate division KSB3 bacterium]